MLIIFDCDGVLVDSERIGNGVLAQMARDLGWELTAEEATRRFKGAAMPQIADEVRARAPLPLPHDFVEVFRRRQFAALKEQLAPIEGVAETLASLTVPFCVASNGPHEKMRVTLGAVGLLELVGERRFSRTDVGRGKPFPDLFLHAAERCSAAPEECLVVEDSSVGIQAAQAAGMRSFGFARTCPEDAGDLLFAGAETVFSDMTELPRLLKLQSA